MWDDVRARVEAALAERGVSGWRGQAVTVVVPDVTRPMDPQATLDPVLRGLRDAGTGSVQILVALGLHRPLETEELAPLTALARRHGATLLQHDPHDKHVLVEVDRDVGLEVEGARRPLPAVIHRAVVEADRTVSLGLVELHQYAGFSGGVKTVAIGCAGAETIGTLHGLEYLRQEGTQVGGIAGNPFRAALERVAARLPPAWALQVVPGAQEVCWGPVDEAFARAAQVAATHMLVNVGDRQWPVARARVEGPKGANFYQASRAATYLALVDRPALREGGLIVVEAPCPEGLGRGTGERACAEAMTLGRERLLAELRGEVEAPPGPRGGRQRAYVLAKSLTRFQVALVGAVRRMPEVEAMGIGQYGSLQEAQATLGTWEDDDEVLEVPDPFHRLPQRSS